MTTRRLPALCLLPVLVVCVAVSSARGAEAGLGYEIASPADACGAGAQRDEDRIPVLIAIDDALLDDPASLDPLFGCAGEDGLQLAARLEPPSDWQHAADPYAALAPWLKRLGSFLAGTHRRIGWFEMGARPETVFEPDAYAFLVEKTSTLIRSMDPDGSLVLGPLGAESGAWLDGVDTSRLAPYVGGIALLDPVDLSAWMQRLSRDYPGRAVWLHTGAPEPGADAAGALLARWDAALRAGVGPVLVRSAPGSAAMRLVLNIDRALPARFVPETSGPPVPGAASILRFADPLGPESALLVPASAGPRVRLGPDPVERLRAFDLHAGASIDLSVSSGPDGTWLELPAGAGPVLARYVVMRGPRAVTETIGVSEPYQLTAPEIIARLRAVETRQDRALDHYEAKATIAYHYRAETIGESIDVASENRFFWKGAVGEYQETDLYVNGARWRGKPPSLPFIAAEKVKEVPLEIRLDKSYDYTLEGTSTIDGHTVYELSFEPVDPNGSTYSGRVWVDADSFVRRRLRLVQHGLREPITSNTDTIEYGAIEPIPGVDPNLPEEARSIWLPVRADRQMVFTVLGRSVAVERRVTYTGFTVNDAGFAPRREQAYASGQPILRDDAAGYTYLVQDENGIRTHRADSLRNVAFFGGIGGRSTGGVGTPFAGMNYFDFDWRGTGTQVDLAYAGVLVDGAWSDPTLGGSKVELTIEGRFRAIGDRFRKIDGDGRQREEYLEVLEQRVWVTFGRPLTTYSRFELRTQLSFHNYDRMDSTDPDFVLPPTRLGGAETGRWRYHRNGTLLDLWATAGHRFGWGDWGLPSGGPGQRGGGDRTEYQQWGATLLKSFYPTRLQKISLGAALFAGHDLDRFSRFRIGDFRNARVHGFNGFDVTFSRGATAELAYLFTLPRGGMSVDLGVDGAVVENDEDFEGRQYLLGGSAGVSFSGPWGTLMSVRGATGMGSSLPIATKGLSLRFVLIKTFDHWPWSKRGRSALTPAEPAGYHDPGAAQDVPSDWRRSLR